MKFSLPILALFGNISAKELIPRDSPIEDMDEPWNNLNYGPYKKTKGPHSQGKSKGPYRWGRALGRPDDKKMKMPVYTDAAGQNALFGKATSAFHTTE